MIIVNYEQGLSKMYNVGEIIFYRSAGLCRIEDVKSEDMGQGKKDYYVLCPLEDEKTKILIPCDNEFLCNKMKKLITSKQAHALISLYAQMPCDWIDNDRSRAEHFKSIIDSGDRQELLRLWKSVEKRDEVLSALGKKPRASDLAFKEQAKKMLLSELCLVLETKEEKIEAYIKNNP